MINHCGLELILRNGVVAQIVFFREEFLLLCIPAGSKNVWPFIHTLASLFHLYPLNGFVK